MLQTLGARLRSQRERQEIELRAIAADTKIKLSLLEGLERDDISYWPAGIFRRAYVRSYARAIGMDPEAVIREFLTVFPDPIELDPPDGQVPAKGGRINTAMAALLRRTATRPPAGPAEPAPASGPVDVAESARVDPGLSAVSELCTRLGRVLDRRELPALLDDATRILDAVGLMVWSWDPRAAVLRVSLANGYSDAVIARWPAVPANAANAVADAFRSAGPCVVPGTAAMTGALVVPLMASNGCMGVLAAEFRGGAEHRDDVRNVATILAAQLVTLLGAVPLAEAVA
jgi:hypothetical protein